MRDAPAIRLIGALADADAQAAAREHAGDPGEIGAKGAMLSALARGGAPTPPAFVLTTDWTASLGSGAVPPGAALTDGLRALEAATQRRFGDPTAPLLLAVRLSPEHPTPDIAPAILGVGAPVSAPIETMSPAALMAERAYWRSLARAAAIAGADPKIADPIGFEEAIEDAYEDALEDGDTPSDARLTLAVRRAALAAAPDAPTDPTRQLDHALGVMARAWASPRAVRRRAATLADDACALIVQALAIGATCTEAGAGQLRLYDGASGAVQPTGRFQFSRLGGERAPGARPDREISAPLTPDAPQDPLVSAAIQAAERVDLALGAPQEIRFVTDNHAAPSALWVVSTRAQRLSAQAVLRIAIDHADAGRISRDDAVLRVPPHSLEQLLHDTVDPDAPRDPIAHGIAASPGAASGRLAFTTDDAETMTVDGEPVVLARIETTPEDIQGMHAAVGVLTTRGGLTSHAAVVARGLGTPCVVGAADARLDIEQGALTTADGRVFRTGDMITIDGSAGEALAGATPTLSPEPTGAFAKLMEWADGVRRLRVRANADTPTDATTAKRLGVDGIGLCRTEHMFFDPARITVMREMILADDEDERRAALARLLPMQRADFVQLFKIMGGGASSTSDAPPVTIRLLDPPLHEFLPQTQTGLELLAQAMNRPVAKVARRASDLKEFNPMLGKRGCRMGVAFPEIYEMQARAIFEAALEVEAADGRSQRPEIMIPLVSAVREFEVLRARIDALAADIRLERSATFDYSVGIMVETPRAALRAGALGEVSSFFSFGTNDLTQMTYGLSRDDAGRLMRDYVERGVFEADPFQSLDQEGVGELMRIAVERGRANNPDLDVGLCGEHGADPATIAFCEGAGFDYVSCSPYRAPIARLAAAQAALRRRGDGGP